MIERKLSLPRQLLDEKTIGRGYFLVEECFAARGLTTIALLMSRPLAENRDGHRS